MLISPDHCAMHAQRHEAGGYGDRGYRWALLAWWLIERVGAESLLDYGCGQGTLARALQDWPGKVTSYDPAVQRYATPPNAADVVVCTGVLEHVEPDRVSVVIGDICRLARKAVLVFVTSRDKPKWNATVMPPGEWTGLFAAHVMRCEVFEQADDRIGFYAFPVPFGEYE